MKKIRLQVALAKAGISSRRKAVELIEGGNVEVNGEKIKEKGFRVDVSNDDIKLDGKSVAFSEKMYYYMLNKPAGILSTASDDRGRKTVLDLLGENEARLYPVGRLDKDTTGLIILTNDGELTYRLTHPKFEIDRVYRTKVKGVPNSDDIRELVSGIEIDGKMAHAKKVVIKSQDANSMTLLVTLAEGRKRQVRNMFMTIGYRVMELERISYGPLVLNNVSEGEFRTLTQEELAKLKTSVGLT